MFDLDKYMNLNYPLVVQQIVDEGTHFYKVSIAELPGFAIYADNMSEIDEEVEDAKKEWFVAQNDLGREIPLPNTENQKSGRITLRIPKTLHTELETNAENDGVTLNSYLNYVIERGLRKISIDQICEKIDKIDFTKSDKNHGDENEN